MTAGKDGMLVASDWLRDRVVARIVAAVECWPA